MKEIIAILFIIFQFVTVWTQNDTLIKNSVYHLNRKIEIPITLGLFVANQYAFHIIDNKTRLDSNHIASLDKKNIWTFDRHAVEQNYSVNYHKDAKKISDLAMNISIFLPALLYFNKNIRKDGFNILLLYLETQGINTILYTSGVIPTNRIRPYLYYPDESMARKLGPGTQDSFFSGHTSSSATASFFMAKVYIDYHPEIKRKKWLLYTAALIPPAFVGYYRYKALMHFPTDIFMGIVTGAATGILIPHFHKIKLGKKQNITIHPFTGSITGLSAKLKILYL